MGKLITIALLAAVVVVMAGAGAVVLLNQTSTQGAQVLEYGQDIKIDDFAFTGLSARPRATSGIRPRKGSIIVAFKVTNHA